MIKRTITFSSLVIVGIFLVSCGDDGLCPFCFGLEDQAIIDQYLDLGTRLL